MSDLHVVTTTAAQADTPSITYLAISLVLLVILLVLDIAYLRDSLRLAKALNLPKGQWVRMVRTLSFDPLIELLAIGALLAADILQNWEHLLAAVFGAAVGVGVGHYRYRIQYVRALPEHRAIVFVRSRAEFVALCILVLVKLASEQHRIPVVGPLTLLVTAGLSVVVFESIGRAWFSFVRYRHDTVKSA